MVKYVAAGLGLVCLVGFLIGSARYATPPSDPASLADVLAQVADGDAQLLDVRSPAEWDESHLREAFWIPTRVLSDPESRAAAADELEADKVIYVHCLRGGRAVKCAAILSEMGFEARPLQVDYEQMLAAGFTEVRGDVADASEND